MFFLREIEFSNLEIFILSGYQIAMLFNFKSTNSANSNSIFVVHFRDLVSTANEWLRKNPGLQPKTCETVTWMSHDPKNLGSGDLMVISKNLNDNTLTYFLNGLR